MQKSKQAENRRLNLLQKQSENLSKQKQQSLERREKASKKIKEQEKLVIEKGKAIERRMEMLNKLLEQKHLNWAKNLEIRNEFQRLKDEEAFYNAERNRRIL